MTREEIHQRAQDCYSTAREHMEPVYVQAQDKCGKLHSRLADVCSVRLLSEVCIFNALLITFGMLIASIFSDFFKKHRVFVVIAFVVSAAMFLLKACQMVGEWEESEKF